jgi:hypothetical protein
MNNLKKRKNGEEWVQVTDVNVCKTNLKFAKMQFVQKTINGENMLTLEMPENSDFIKWKEWCKDTKAKRVVLVKSCMFEGWQSGNNNSINLISVEFADNCIIEKNEKPTKIHKQEQICARTPTVSFRVENVLSVEANMSSDAARAKMTIMQQNKNIHFTCSVRKPVSCVVNKWKVWLSKIDTTSQINRLGVSVKLSDWMQFQNKTTSTLQLWSIDYDSNFQLCISALDMSEFDGLLFVKCCSSEMSNRLSEMIGMCQDSPIVIVPGTNLCEKRTIDTDSHDITTAVQIESYAYERIFTTNTSLKMLEQFQELTSDCLSKNLFSSVYHYHGERQCIQATTEVAHSIISRNSNENTKRVDIDTTMLFVIVPDGCNTDAITKSIMCRLNVSKTKVAKFIHFLKIDQFRVDKNNHFGYKRRIQSELLRSQCEDVATNIQHIYTQNQSIKLKEVHIILTSAHLHVHQVARHLLQLTISTAKHVKTAGIAKFGCSVLADGADILPCSRNYHPFASFVQDSNILKFVNSNFCKLNRNDSFAMLLLSFKYNGMNEDIIKAVDVINMHHTVQDFQKADTRAYEKLLVENQCISKSGTRNPTAFYVNTIDTRMLGNKTHIHNEAKFNHKKSKSQPTWILRNVASEISMSQTTHLFSADRCVFVETQMPTRWLYCILSRMMPGDKLHIIGSRTLYEQTKSPALHQFEIGIMSNQSYNDK